MNKKQQNQLVGLLVVIGVAAAIVFFAGPFYILNEGEQAVIVRFGAIVDVHTEAGLRLKMPVIDNVVVYPKKLISWDGEPRSMLTAEKQSIWVDTTARWRIKDAKQFYASIGGTGAANSRITDVIESAVRTIIAENLLAVAVRNSNTINETTPAVVPETKASAEDNSITEVERELSTLINSTEKFQDLKEGEGRRALSQQMLVSARPALEQLGIDVVDIIIRQIRYTDEVTESVYSRMISERNRIAQAYRSFGEGKKNDLMGQTEKQLKSIISGAYKEAETIKGSADAKAAYIYSQAYQRDPEFFKFWRAMESYRKTMGSFTKTLSTDMDYFKYLYSVNGR
jgi:membrane protease subunit HflC